MRAVSIALVLLSHASATRGAPAWLGRALPAVGAGNLGVRVFFVISGLLITRLLLREQRRTGGVALGAFYLRRTFRIFPAYYVFLGALVAAAALGWRAPVPELALLHAATYTTNYSLIETWVVGHTWSLSVEEQFYLLWPPLLAWAGGRAAFLVARGFVLLAPAIRLARNSRVTASAPASPAATAPAARPASASTAVRSAAPAERYRSLDNRCPTGQRLGIGTA
jgi:peptidoglycan/LPS O-acetylase OafA/YrhL